MYGADRMEKALNRIQDLSPKGVLKGIREDVDLFTEGAAQFDDMTMLCVKYTEKKGKQRVSYSEGVSS